VPKLLPRVLVVDPEGEIHLLLEADSMVDGSSEQQRFAAAIAAGKGRERSGSKASQASKSSYVSRNSQTSKTSKEGSDGPASILNFSALGSGALCQVEDLTIAEGSAVFELEAATDPDGFGMQLMYCRARALTSASIASALGWSEVGGIVPHASACRDSHSHLFSDLSPVPHDARTTR